MHFFPIMEAEDKGDIEIGRRYWDDWVDTTGDGRVIRWWKFYNMYLH